MTNRVERSLRGHPPEQTQRLFIRGPSGHLSTASPATRTELERFATALRAVVGARVAQVRAWPYRQDSTTWWSFDIEGGDRDISLTFEESGCTHLPHDSLRNGTGSVADSVDAFYLFEFLERELVSPCGSV
jgi:hypothetical protein